MLLERFTQRAIVQHHEALQIMLNGDCEGHILLFHLKLETDNTFLAYLLTYNILF